MALPLPRCLNPVSTQYSGIGELLCILFDKTKVLSFLTYIESRHTEMNCTSSLCSHSSLSFFKAGISATQGIQPRYQKFRRVVLPRKISEVTVSKVR